jgi:hypothetical protein
MEKGTCLLIGTAITGDRNVTKRDDEKVTTEMQRYVGCRNKSDTINRSNRNNLHTIQKISEQH